VEGNAAHELCPTGKQALAQVPPFGGRKTGAKKNRLSNTNTPAPAIMSAKAFSRFVKYGDDITSVSKWNRTLLLATTVHVAGLNLLLVGENHATSKSTGMQSQYMQMLVAYAMNAGKCLDVFMETDLEKAYALAAGGDAAKHVSSLNKLRAWFSNPSIRAALKNVRVHHFDTRHYRLEGSTEQRTSWGSWEEAEYANIAPTYAPLRACHIRLFADWAVTPDLGKSWTARFDSSAAVLWRELQHSSPLIDACLEEFGKIIDGVVFEKSYTAGRDISKEDVLRGELVQLLFLVRVRRRAMKEWRKLPFTAAVKAKLRPTALPMSLVDSGMNQLWLTDYYLFYRICMQYNTRKRAATGACSGSNTYAVLHAGASHTKNMCNWLVHLGKLLKEPATYTMYVAKKVRDNTPPFRGLESMYKVKAAHRNATLLDTFRDLFGTTNTSRDKTKAKGGAKLSKADLAIAKAREALLRGGRRKSRASPKPKPKPKSKPKSKPKFKPKRTSASSRRSSKRKGR
jgi:hypothetical protein